MTKKYKLTHHTKEILGHTLHQIKAVKSFDNECTLWLDSYPSWRDWLGL